MSNKKTGLPSLNKGYFDNFEDVKIFLDYGFAPSRFLCFYIVSEDILKKLLALSAKEDIHKN